MAKENVVRSSCRDVFNAFLVSDAEYAGKYEFPILFPTYKIPNRLISFVDALKTKDYDQWVHFYLDDALFERLWRQPRKYLPLLKRFNGVILPDYSCYRDMPFAMQIWNIYRSRAIGHWLQQNSVEIIVNIRYGDDRTYDCCCDGVSQNCVIAMGTHGTMKIKEDREIFLQGLDYVIAIHQFESDFSIKHKKEVD